MIALPAPQADAATKYLATHFPEKPGRRPTLVPGDVKITFKEWKVPTLGQRSRDPIQMKDGTIYWTGMYGSLIGQLNPATGEMKEFKLDPKARPHSITADAAGNIWYTGNGNGTIGKLNPATGEITSYPMPAGSRPRPAHCDLRPEGDDVLYPSAKQHAGPHDSRDGRSDAGGHADQGRARRTASRSTRRACPGSPITAATRWRRSIRSRFRCVNTPCRIPRPRIRRLALGSDDMIYYVDSARGYIGRFNPKTGEQKDWPSPSGPTSHPYAIAVVDDIVWYNESGMRPDTLVRFDPKTEKFQSWAIPSGVGIVSHMTVSPDGNLVFHQSSINRVGLVIIEKPAATTTRR